MTSTRPVLRTRRVSSHELRARGEAESQAQLHHLVGPTRTTLLSAGRRGRWSSRGPALAGAGGALCVLTVMLMYVLVMSRLAAVVG
ncbi:hypothetical protein ACFQE5_11550 [Pseudonocardia hispaniensis]|uniref:Uncharacterized protein n=1 Tax=Pseudonocardia hispaniensis TaxID=904933 RepID=A0ABW1J235_9PSEU